MPMVVCRAEFRSPAGNDHRILRLLDRRSDHRIDVDVEFRILRQPLQLLVEHLQAFLRDLVRQDIVDADLQRIEPGTIQALDAIGGEQEAIGDECRDQPWLRMRRIRSSKSGCSKGSPPLNVIMVVPNSCSRSMRRSMTSVGTGCETLSYSLQ